MGWTLAEDWLSVADLILLTFGTGAQAFANLAEFKNLQASISKAAQDAIKDSVDEAISTLTNLDAASMAASMLALIMHLIAALIARKSFLGAVLMPGRIAQLQAEGGDEAVELARFMRLAQVWGVIMIGSAFGLAAAVIQLVLAYT